MLLLKVWVDARWIIQIFDNVHGFAAGYLSLTISTSARDTNTAVFDLRWIIQGIKRENPGWIWKDRLERFSQGLQLSDRKIYKRYYP